MLQTWGVRGRTVGTGRVRSNQPVDLDEIIGLADFVPSLPAIEVGDGYLVALIGGRLECLPILTVDDLRREGVR